MSEEQQPTTRRGPDEKLWYLVATAGGDAEAGILKGALESAGIPVWVYREAAGRALGLGVGPLGASFLYTTEPYYEAALDLLAGPDEPDELEDGDYVAGEAVYVDEEDEEEDEDDDLWDDDDDDDPWDDDDDDEDWDDDEDDWEDDEDDDY